MTVKSNNEENSDVSKKLLKSNLNDSSNKKIAQFEVEHGAKVKKAHSSAYLKLHGISFGVLSAFFYALSSTLVKKTKIFTGSEMAAIQYVIRICLLTSIARYKGLNIFGKPGQRKLLAYRGLSGALTMIFINFSTKLIVPSDSIALLHTNVIMVAILARIFLGDKFTMLHLLILILTAFGVLFISQPTFLKSLLGYQSGALVLDSTIIGNITNAFKNFDCQVNNSSSNCLLGNLTVIEALPESSFDIKLYLGIFFGIAAATASAAVAVLLKKLNKIHVHYSIAIVYAAYVGLPIAICLQVVMYLTKLEPSKDWSIYTTGDLLWQFLWCFISGLTGIAAQATYHVSLKHEEPTVISVVRCTDLFFTFILQYLFMNITANFLSTTGAVLIFLATLLTLLFKVIAHRVNSVNTKNEKLMEATTNDNEQDDDEKKIAKSCLKPLHDCLNFGC